MATVHKYSITFDGIYTEFLSEQDRNFYISSLGIANYILDDFDSEIVENSSDPIQEAEKEIADAIYFGKWLMIRFCSENLIMGIENSGLTDKIRAVLEPTFNALETGSLTTAIEKLNSIQESDKDSTFITNSRILNYVTLITNYLEG